MKSVLGFVLFIIGGALLLFKAAVFLTPNSTTFETKWVFGSLLMLMSGFLVSGFHNDKNLKTGEMEFPMIKRALDKISSTLELQIIVTAMVSILVLVIFYTSVFGSGVILADHEKFGQVGDFFGGILNPILTFLTLFLLIKHNWDLEKRELQKDEDDGIKVKDDFFLKMMEVLDRKIKELSFNDDSGYLAIKAFNKAQNDLTPVDVEKFGSQLLPVSNLLNALISETSKDALNKESTKIFMRNCKRYQILTQNYSGEFVNEVKSAKDTVKEKSEALRPLFDEIAIDRLKEFFMKRRGNTYMYPDIGEVEALNAISAEVEWR